MPTNTDERNLDLHNAAIDEALARTGRCGAVHLATGRTCLLAARHPGGCAFGEAGRALSEAGRALGRRAFGDGGRALGEHASTDPEP